MLAERKERLLTEFMGERVKVRERGYKTMRQAEVTAREVTVFDHASYSHKPTGEFEPWLRYTSDVRTQDINRMQRLDVRVGSKWMTVWDDGLDDLPYYDNNLSTSAAPADPYDGRL